MHKHLFSILLLFIISNKVCAQFIFEKNIPEIYVGTAWAEEPTHLVLLPDSNYAFSAISFSVSNSLLIGKISKQGIVMWVKQIDYGFTLGTNPNLTYSADGFFYITYSVYNGTTMISILLKLDNAGNLIFGKQYGNANLTQFSEHIFTSQSSVYIAGEMQTIPGGFHSMFLYKLDKSGNYIWGKNYFVGQTYEYLRAAKIYSNNEILLSGIAFDSDPTPDTLNNNYHMSLFKLDTNGAVLWNKKVKTPNKKEFNGHALTEDLEGNIIIAGRIDTINTGMTFGLWDGFMMKLGASGNFKWAKYFGQQDYDETYNVKCTSDNGFIMAAEPESFDTLSRISLIKFDSLGIIQWMKLYGKKITGGFPNDIVINKDKGYTILATKGDYGSHSDLLLLRTDSLGNSYCANTTATLQQGTFSPFFANVGNSSTLTGSSIYIPSVSNLTLITSDYCFVLGLNANELPNNLAIYPNPNNGLFYLKIDSEIKNGQLILINIIGQKVYEQKLIQGSNEIKTNGLPMGLYNYILLQGNQTVKTGKLTIE